MSKNHSKRGDQIKTASWTIRLLLPCLLIWLNWPQQKKSLKKWFIMIIFSSLKASSDFGQHFRPRNHIIGINFRLDRGSDRKSPLNSIAIYRGSVCVGLVRSTPSGWRKKMKLLTLSTGISGFCFDLETGHKDTRPWCIHTPGRKRGQKIICIVSKLTRLSSFSIIITLSWPLIGLFSKARPILYISS